MEFIDESGAPLEVHQVQDLPGELIADDPAAVSEPVPVATEPAPTVAEPDPAPGTSGLKGGKKPGKHSSRYIIDKLHRRQKYTKACNSLAAKVRFPYIPLSICFPGNGVISLSVTKLECQSMFFVL